MLKGEIKVPRGFDSFFFNNKKEILEDVILKENITEDDFENCVEILWSNPEKYQSKYPELSYSQIVQVE